MKWKESAVVVTFAVERWMVVVVVVVFEVFGRGMRWSSTEGFCGRRAVVGGRAHGG